MPHDFDVFLSHDSRDKPTVRRLAQALEERGLKVWLDEWKLQPGRPWQEAIEQAIGDAPAAAVILGPQSTRGAWTETEMRALINEAAQRRIPVIPVLLPGAGEPPTFLQAFTWVDLRRGITAEGIDLLVWGIRGGDRPASLAARKLGQRGWRIATLVAFVAAVALGSAYLLRPGERAVVSPVILSEVMYDPGGPDNGYEWVELYNASDEEVDLSTYSLGSGGPSYTTTQVQLEGTLAPGETLVVGGPLTDASNANPEIDLEWNFRPDLQNSDSVADGVALFHLPTTNVTPSTVPVDAVIYGSDNVTGLIDQTGAARSPQVGAAPEGSSIERTSLAGSWRIQSQPMPNSTPLAGARSATSGG